MEINKNEIITTHKNYDEYELHRLNFTLAIGDQIELLINGQSEKSYTVKFVSCNGKLVIQDKGEKKDITLLEQKIYDRDLLNEQIVALEESK